MFWNIVWCLGGALVAWQIPQPSWAKKATDTMKAKLKEFFDTSEDSQDSKNG